MNIGESFFVVCSQFQHLFRFLTAAVTTYFFTSNFQTATKSRLRNDFQQGPIFMNFYDIAVAIETHSKEKCVFDLR